MSLSKIDNNSGMGASASATSVAIRDSFNDSNETTNRLSALPFELRGMIFCEVLISPNRDRAVMIGMQQSATHDRHVDEGLRLQEGGTPREQRYIRRSGIEHLTGARECLREAQYKEVARNQYPLRASRVALMFTCRQFRSQAAEIYFKLNQFYFDLKNFSHLLYNFTQDMLKCPIHRGPSERNAIQIITNISIELIPGIREDLFAFENLQHLHIRSAHTVLECLQPEIASSLGSSQWREFMRRLPHLRDIKIDKDFIGLWKNLNGYRVVRVLFMDMNRALRRRSDGS